MNTAVWSALHFLVDFVCACAMYAFFCDGSYESLLIYNFCAFALQLPLGTLLDLCKDRCHRIPTFCATLGACVTLLGVILHPAILGLGNALFHVGAGIDVLETDRAKGLKGRGLGVFVAPGAIGLYLGAMLGKRTGHPAVFVAVCLLMVVLLALQWRKGSADQIPVAHSTIQRDKLLIVAICCFVVVVIRSYVGLAITFPWKSLPLLGALAVLGAASGKMCGGFLAAKFGLCRTVVATLLLASVLYAFGTVPICGLIGIFLFNMSMPLTLYLLAELLPELPGFSFGLLTFGLFLGFLPVYWQVELSVSPSYLGTIGSLISCVLLFGAGKAAKHHA